MEITKSKEEKIKEPFIRIIGREDLNWKKKALVRAICLFSGVVLCIISLWIIGKKDPFPAVGIIFQGTFGNSAKFWQTIQEMVLLLGIGLALVPAYEMRFWNVGAQGQVLMGALGCAVVMIYGKNLPSSLVIFLSLISGVAFGAIWGWIPAFFKAKWNTNETLFTLMMNYMAIQLVSFATINWKGVKTSMGYINNRTYVGWLANINNNPVIMPLILVLVLVVLMYIYINKTKHGYELKVIGESINTARYSGIKVKWTIMRTLLLSGALCGLIGFIYVAGIDHTISTTTSGSYGFTSIIICWLANFNPFLMIVFSFGIVFLNRGAINLKNQAYADSLNEYSCELLVFLLILAVMLSEFFIRYRLIIKTPSFIKERKKEEVQNG